MYYTEKLGISVHDEDTAIKFLLGSIINTERLNGNSWAMLGT